MDSDLICQSETVLEIGRPLAAILTEKSVSNANPRHDVEQFYYGGVMWASWRLKSQATRLFVGSTSQKT